MTYSRNLARALFGGALIVVLSTISMAGDKQGTAKDEAAIREAGKAYIQARRSHDAKGLAASWTADGIFVDANGNSFNAQKLIAQRVKKDVETRPTAPVDVEFESTIRFVTPDVAIEEGTTRKDSGGEAAVGHFTVVWVKEGERWQIDKLTERESTAVLGRNSLDSLRWMIGDWVGESAQGKILCSTQWSQDKKFLLRRFSINHEGKEVMSGTQRIGWDPAARRVRSWTFDSHGGIVEGWWDDEGESWIVKTRGSLPDGRRSSAAVFWIPEGPDRAVLKSTHVKAGADAMGDIVVEFRRTTSSP